MYGFRLVIQGELSEDYDKLLGDNIGENIADVMDECLYTNIKTLNESGEEVEVFQDGALLEGTSVTLAHVMLVILQLFQMALRPQSNSSFSSFLRYLDYIKKYSNNYVTRETSDGKVILTYYNITCNVLEAFLWGAYFYASILSFISKEAGISEALAEKKASFERARDVLWNQMVKASMYREEDFRTQHFSNKLTKQYFEPTAKKVLEDFRKTSKESKCEEKNDETDIILLHKIAEKQHQTINNLKRQNSQLKSRIAELEAALNPTGIREGYESDVDSVFLPTFTVAGQTVGTHDRVRKVGRHCIDPNEPKQVALFVEACSRLGAVRNLGIVSPTKIVRSLIGLGVLEKDKESKNYIENVRRKLNNLIAEKNLNVDEDKLDIMIRMLKKSVII